MLKCISVMSQTNAIGWLLNCKSTFTKSWCNFGLGWIASLNDFPLNSADLPETILTLVVDLLGRRTGKCGRYHYQLYLCIHFPDIKE